MALGDFPDGTVLATIPRYEAFTRYGRWLAAQGIDFREIAGNSGEVVVSLLAPDPWAAPAGNIRVLFTQPIFTRPGNQRVVLAVPIAELADELRRDSPGLIGVSVEHIYDF